MKIREGSISYWILVSLEKATEGVLSLDKLSYSSQMRAIKGIPEPQKEKSLAVAIKRLRRKGLLEYERENEGKIILKLTNLSREYMSENYGTGWDGKYRIVMWDIPERKRSIRNLFRRKLKEWKFIQLQRSVWVSRRNVTFKLKKMINEYDMGKWVTVIESEDASLNNLF